YEAYGPGGAALIVDCLTDSRERTGALLRQILRRHGGHLGAPGAVSYLFNPVGLIEFSPGSDVARLTHCALQARPEEVVRNPGGSVAVLADPGEFEDAREGLRLAGFVPVRSEKTERAAQAVPVQGDVAVMLRHLLSDLRKLNEVENLYTNAQIPD